MNPKIYFKVVDGVLIPIKKQNGVLDALFQGPAIKRANQNNYNEYTQEFVSSHNNDTEIYKSEFYSWNPKNSTFNFSKIDPISDEEYMLTMSYKTSFNPMNPYDFTTKQQNTQSNQTTKSSTLVLLNEIRQSHPVPSIEECGMYVDTFNWNYLVRNIIRKRNTILVGPTGTGKTELVMMIAKNLGLDCHVYDMGSMQDPMTDLLGSHRLENGSSIFDYAKFTEHIQKPGVIVLDELSRAPLMANNILFPCLDSRRELPVEIADSKSSRNIKVHPDCVFIATANIGIEYSGTNEIDAALFNRFLPLQLDYIPAKNEIDVLVNRTGITQDQATKIVNFANRIRKDYRDEILTKSCSTRETIAMAEMVADGFSYVESFKSVILYKYSNSNDEEVAHINKLLVTL